MILLRQSTSVVVNFGTFVDKTDGVSLEIGLATAMDNATTGIRLSKNGAAYADRGDATVPAYDAMGDYRITLSTTDTGTLGVLRMVFEEAATTLPVWKEFMVVPANVYDSLVLGTDVLDTSVIQWLGTAVATPSVAGRPSVDAIAVSGDTVAADNLELQYDTTGLLGDTFPATQAQVGNIASGSVAIGYNATGFTLTTGVETLTYTATTARDGVLHEIADSAGTTDGYYTLTLPGNAFVVGVKWAGYIQSNADTVEFQFYNWVTSAYVTEATLIGTNGTTIVDEPVPAVNVYTGTGVNLGQVRFRVLSTTSTNIATDRLLFEATTVSQSVGYANGAIWFDSNASNTNTEIYIDGTADNPVSTEAAVNTLIASTGLKRVQVALDSSVTFATDHAEEHWTGEHWAAVGGGRAFSGAHIGGADVSGVWTGTTAIDFLNSRIDTATIHPFHMKYCGFNGTLTLGAVGNYIISGGHSAIAGSTTPIIDTGAALANVNLAMPEYYNGVEIRNLNAAGTDLFSISGIGQIIYAASSSGTVNQRGDWKVTNTGGVTITEDDNTATLTQLNLGIIYGAAATGTLSTTQATTDLTGYTADQLIGRTIIVTSGVAEGEGSDITDYVEAAGLITFTAMTLAMGNTDTFKIV